MPKRITGKSHVGERRELRQNGGYLRLRKQAFYGVL